MTELVLAALVRAPLSGRGGGPSPFGGALQAASYAWMIARTTDRPVETRLIWWPLDEVSPSSIPVPWSLHEVETRLLARIAPVDLPFAVQLRAKRDLCATGIVWCDESACTLAADPGPRGDRVLAELLGKTVLDGADLLDLGTREAVCPYALAHTAGARLPFSIADVHHLVHPYPLRGRAGEDVFEGAIVIVDEIHNLLDRAREAGSATLDAALVRAALERAALGSDPLHRAQRELTEQTLALLEESANEAGLAGSGDEPRWVTRPRRHGSSSTSC